MNEKCFYVCSYGGSGSKMLCKALNAYGKTKHIHSRKPPNKLEYIGYENGGNTYEEWFNGVVIPEENLKYYFSILLNLLQTKMRKLTLFLKYIDQSF